MVVGTGLAVATVMTGGTAAAAGAAIGTVAGAGEATLGTAGALGAAIGVGGSGGAIAGAGATGTVVGTAVGSAAGSAAAAAVTGSGTGISALLAGAGPVGWLALGAAENGNQLTFDCWKPVIHDISVEPSNGILLKDIFCHPNMANVTMETTDGSSLPHIVLENVWQEKFEIEYYVIKDTGRLVAHAKPVVM